MGTPIELAGVAVVGAGSFNPAILHPRWLVDKGLLPENVADHALDQIVVTPQLTAYTADWLSLQVTQEQAIFATVEEGRELDLRDLARGVFELLPETPVNAVGLNADAHFRVASEEAWHAFGDRFLPKDFWQPLFEGDTWRRRDDGQTVGMRSMVVEAHREDGRGFVRVEVAPSVRMTPLGVYCGVNAHFQLTLGEKRGNGFQAAQLIVDEWEATRALETDLVAGVAEAQ